jgi:hypothetical protein
MAPKKRYENKFFSTPVFHCCFWIRDPRWLKIRIRAKHPGSATLLFTLPEPELEITVTCKSRNRNRNFSKVGTGTVKDSYGSTTLHLTHTVSCDLRILLLCFSREMRSVFPFAHMYLLRYVCMKSGRYLYARVYFCIQLN